MGKNKSLEDDKEEKKYPLRLDNSDYAELVEIGKVEDRSINYLINKAVKEYIKKYKINAKKIKDE